MSGEERGGEARSIGDIAAGIRPKARRTGQPVRRNSYHAGEREKRHWRPISPREIGPRIAAAAFYDKENRQPGKRNGPLGHIGVEVLRELYRLVCYRTGRLEPSIDYLMSRLKRSRAAVVRALAALKQHGFLDWIRRTEPTGNSQGPQVRQITNAYWFSLPKAAMNHIKRLIGKAPPPDDDAQRRRCAEDDTRQMIETLPMSDQMAMTIDDPNLASSLARLGERVFDLNASSPKSQNPA